MGGRKQKGDYPQQEAYRTRSFNRKPPLGNWQPTVPSWEKKFCSSVGSFPWHKLLERKKFIYLYENVLQWNDSAGEEAFHNAKNRFWAQINGLHCNISLPDPDIYIDKVDWNCSIDPELILDLEQDPVVPDDSAKNEVSSLGYALLLQNQSFSGSGWGVGWGDAEDVVEKDFEPVAITGWGEKIIEEPVKATGWGDWDQHVEATGWGESNGAMEVVPVWKDNWNNSSGCDNKYNDWGNVNDGRAADGVWGTGNGNSSSRGGGGGTCYNNMSRYRSSRFHDSEYQADHRGWRKRANFVHDEVPFFDKKAASKERSTMPHCGPVSHHGSGKAGNSWSLKKPVS